MTTVYLVHWHEQEIEERAKRLRAAGYRVRKGWQQGGAPARELRERPADIVVIDLARLPSHGREFAQYVRERKATRGLPIVFIEGAPEKTARAKRDFPECTFATWRGIRGAVKKTLAKPLAPETQGASTGGRGARVRSTSSTDASPAGYSGTPLPKKLGVKAGATLALLGAPADFDATLGELPPDVSVRRRASGACDVIVLFTKRRTDLVKRFAIAERALADGGGLWVAWPKKTSGVATDLSQPVVQRVGLDAGLVDNKICAIDETWSGQRFMRRRK